MPKNPVSTNGLPSLRGRAVWFWMLGVLLLGAGWVEGAAANYSFRSRLWQADDGLPNNMVHCLAQTTDGYLWVGTQTGVARFDGHQFQVLPLEDEQDGRHRINALWAGHDGSLWIGTAGHGLYQYQQGKVTAHPLPELADQMILRIFEDEADVLWVGTRTGLVRREKPGAPLVMMGRTNAPPNSPEKSVCSQSVRTIEEDADGKLWMGVAENVFLLNRTNLQFSPLNIRRFNPDFIRAICFDRQGRIWMGGNSGLILQEKGKFTMFTKKDGLPDTTVTAVHEDHLGVLWVGTFGGLCRFADGKFIPETTGDGELYDQISCFLEDREHNLWIGSKEGLHRLNAQAFTTLTRQHGLAHNNVVSVYEDTEGSLWVGTWGGGLHQIKDGQLKVYNTVNTPGLRNDKILSLYEPRAGGLWFGADYDGGFYRLQDGALKHYGQEQRLPRNAARTFMEDRTGKLWVGMASGGLFLLNEGKWTVYHQNNGLPTNAIRCLLETRDGQIWIGSESGLLKWTNGGFLRLTTTNGLSHDAIFCLHQDKEQNLWVGTARGGLNRIKNGEIKPFLGKTGLGRGTIVEILEDDEDNFWLATARGVLRVAKHDLADFDRGKSADIPVISYGKADGMASEICVGVAKPSAWKSRDGRLWFATTKGLAVTDPRLPSFPNEVRPPVIITEVLADKHPVENAPGGFAAGETVLTTLPGRGELEFHYTALSFVDPDQNNYKYKLEGEDDDWVTVGHRRVAYYNNLTPGTYRFHVRGSNNDGIWCRQEAMVTVLIRPQVWQTWWFRTLLVGLLGAGVAGAARYVTKRRLQRRLERLEQQHAVEKERSRIAQDMHDEVGAKLTKITFMGGVAKHRLDRPEEAGKEIDKIMHTARDLIGSLDEIVWAVDPRNDTLDNFANYLCRHASEFFDGSPIFCELDVPDDVPHHALTADVRHNLFLALKEALHNVLKHSGATKVLVRLVVRPGEFEVLISDNGRGYVPAPPDPADAKTKRVGNGLRNMQQRLESIGGKCELAGKAGEGTRLTFTVPLRVK